MTAKYKKQKDKKKHKKKQANQNQPFDLASFLPQPDEPASQEQDEHMEIETLTLEQAIPANQLQLFSSVIHAQSQIEEKMTNKIYEPIIEHKEQQKYPKKNQVLSNPLDENNSDSEPKISKKQRKMLRWLKVADLKSKVSRPDLVEFWDITSPDPMFLVHLKSVKNSVPVPRHWCQKRKYLQNKRGILKSQFKLPDFIESTGISKLRDPFIEKDGARMVKQKLRERMNPKQGKLDIDYGVLHDAFFKHQKKPVMTTHGDIYYEGKEDELRARHLKPGRMSAELRNALGISDYQAPPWLPNMQRYGPPPSYPYMRFIGVAAAFSDGPLFHKTQVRNAIEETQKKLDAPGLYATFRYVEEDELELNLPLGIGLGSQAILRDEGIDKGVWGEIDEEDIQEEDDYHDDIMLRVPVSQEDPKPAPSLIEQTVFQTAERERERMSSNLEKPLFTVLEQVQKEGTGKDIFGVGFSYILNNK